MLNVIGQKKKERKNRSIVLAAHRDARPFNAFPAVCVSKMAVWESPYQDRQRYAWLATSLSYISMQSSWGNMGYGPFVTCPLIKAVLKTRQLVIAKHSSQGNSSQGTGHWKHDTQMQKTSPVSVMHLLCIDKAMSQSSYQLNGKPAKIYMMTET